MSITEFSPDAPLRPGVAIVEASAGTGKTYTITTLVLRLVMQEGLPLRDILVVTFTEAATAELRDRIRRRLRDAASALRTGACDHDDWLHQLVAEMTQAQREQAQQRVQAALIGFDEAMISTIHGFCLRMLEEYAFASGATFDAELVTDQTPLVREIVEDYFIAGLHDAPPGLLHALRSAKPAMTPDYLTRIARLAVADPDLVVLPEPPHTAAELLDAWQPALAALRDAWRLGRAQAEALLIASADHFNKPYGAEQTADRFRTIERWLLDEPAPLDAPAELAFLTPAPIRDQWSKRNKRPSPVHPLFEACDALQRLVEARLQTLALGIAAHARAKLAARKDALLVQGFDDLLLRLRDALRGSDGAALARTIRLRYRAALIDEFQDTDPIQYEIFHGVFAPPAGEDAPFLFLIGDPKQAIYSFRGADIHTYLDAATAAAEHATTLSKNRRSDATLLRGIEQLFSRHADPFLDARIRFHSPQPHHADRLTFADGARPPLIVRFAFTDDVDDAHLRGKTAPRIHKGFMDECVPGIAASEVVDLLESGAQIEGRGVRPGDIAILVRKNAQARALQQELARRRVPSVLHGDSSVFDSAEAGELTRVLRAVLEPSSTRLVKAALTTDLMGVRGDELARMLEDDHATDWERHIEALRDLGDLWRRRGFIQMFHALLDRFAVVSRTLAQIGGERRMTNVLHLAEILQRASREERKGPTALLRFLELARDADHEYTSIEARQVRLESDADAVSLVTIHRSKGLQYPIVMCPYLWDGQTLFKADTGAFVYHDANRDHRRVLYLGDDDAARQAAEQEARQENVRLLYVALTRACHTAILYTGAVVDVEKSALAHLLFGNGSANESEAMKGMPAADLYAHVADLAGASGGAIGCSRLPAASRRVYTPQDGAPRPLAAREPRRRIDPYWRASSFSQMTAHVPYASPQAAGHDHADTPAATRAASTPAPIAEPAPGLLTFVDFPRGAAAGTLLHEILEHADFAPAQRDELPPLAERVLRAHGLPTTWTDGVVAGLAAALDAPLPIDGGACLAAIAGRDQLRELGFVLPVAQTATVAHGLTGTALAVALREHADPAVIPATYLDQLEALGFDPLRGYLRGFIDLVFATGSGADRRFHVVDYKSNHLGTQAADYQQEPLRHAMASHHYFLQYHLYLVALHRYLRARLPDYDPARNLGSALYLFLRGMSLPGAAAGGTGIFHDRPAVALIERLDALLDDAGAGA